MLNEHIPYITAKRSVAISFLSNVFLRYTNIKVEASAIFVITRSAMPSTRKFDGKIIERRLRGEAP